ncbi:MAG TPA: hypothetical protein EYP68_08765 [Candidatus Korarchaeota archaeon]|nr:hypothetical protein [Candidatus Korarchaeota archaeon]
MKLLIERGNIYYYPLRYIRSREYVDIKGMFMAKYVIYIACGSAAASANVVKSRLTEKLYERGVRNFELRIARVAELPSITQRVHPDLVIITAGSFSKAGIPEDIPVLSGIPLMTMIGVDQFIDQVVQALKSKKKAE